MRRGALSPVGLSDMLWWGMRSCFRSAPFSGFVCGDGQEGVGEHGQGDVPVPGVVFADLVFVEPDLVLTGAEAFLDWPAGAGHGDQITESCVFGVVAFVVGEFAGVD